MANAKDELTTLKMRAVKNEGGHKITLIDHTANKRNTCTVAQGIQILSWLVNEGGGALHSIHIVDLGAEKERKLTNPKKSTKRLLNCRTPEQWTELNAALEPFYEEAVDPHVAIDLIIRALADVPRETIKSWLQEGSDDPCPAQSEDLPEFLRD